ncbi:Non-motile and phage-resistance protein [compost metagenome]
MQISTQWVAEETYKDLLGSYQELLCAYLAHPEDSMRKRAARLGRSMIARDLGPDVLIAVHHEALRNCPRDGGEDSVKRAGDLLVEALYAFTSAYRDLARERQEDVQRLERYTKALESFNQDMVRLNHELQEQKAELTRSKDELQSLANQKSDLLSTVSHEIRTPLTSLLGYGEFLEEGLYGEMHPQQIEILHRMVQGGRDLLELINNLLDMSKLEANRIELHCEPVRISILISNALEKVAPLAQRKGVSLSALPIPDDFPLVEVDAMRIIQVLVNLVGNAVKFTDPGGSVEVGARQVGNEVQVYVTDTGIGIPIDEQKRLFERFTQAENIKRYGGTGLGLAISRELIALHGGRIWVESTPQKGATFTFTLPIWHEGP